MDNNTEVAQPSRPTHVAVVDFSNHHFIMRGIAETAVEHLRLSYVYSADFQSPNMRNAAENYGSDVIAVSLGEPFQKYKLIRRRRQEKAWAKHCIAVLEDLSPDAILAANCPVDVLEALHKWARRHRTGFGVWVQDLYGPIMERLLGAQMKAPGTAVGRYYTNREHQVLADADLVAAIDPSLQTYIQRHIYRDSVLLSNWAAIDDLPQVTRENDWAAGNGFADTRNVVYAGTLGMKHSPGMLVDLAEKMRPDPDARVIVVSEGLGADLLVKEKASRQLHNLILLPFQPPETLAQILGTADICAMLLNESASDYCIPSKLLSYLCAGRPVVAAMPPANPAAGLIKRLEIGSVVESTDSTGFVSSVSAIFSKSEAERRLMGKRARLYAEAEFDPEQVQDRLVDLLSRFKPR